MTKLFPTYEVGSLPKLNARVKATKGEAVNDFDIKEIKAYAKRCLVSCDEAVDILERQKKMQTKLNAQEKVLLTDFNALLNLKLEEALGLDFVYDGEARRVEMYAHVAKKVEGFEYTPEMIRSRGPDSWRMAICVAEPKLKENVLDELVGKEFDFVAKHATHQIKVPLDDPYMIAVMSDNRYFLEVLKAGYADDPSGLRYEAKLAFTLALARNVIRPQVEAVVGKGAQWIQLDIPAATLDIGHIPILVEGVNAVVEGFEEVKFSLHLCYPRRVSLLTSRKGYELLLPGLLDLFPQVNHLSLELANADEYEKDLAVFKTFQKERRFEIGVGVVDISL